MLRAKMRTETIKLYKFGELSEEAQEKAIEEYRQHDYIWDGWWEFMHEDFHERLKEIGIECEEFYWDFERGRYFSMQNSNIMDVNLFLTSAGFQKQLILCSLEGIDLSNLDIGITEDRECTNRIDVNDYNFDFEEGEEEREKIRNIFGEDFEEKLTNYLQDILYGFLKELEREYEYMCSDEYIKEEIINNEYEFTKEGERY